MIIIIYYVRVVFSSIGCFDFYLALDLTAAPAEATLFLDNIQNTIFAVTEEASCIFFHYYPLINRVQEYGENLSGSDAAAKPIEGYRRPNVNG